MVSWDARDDAACTITGTAFGDSSRVVLMQTGLRGDGTNVALPPLMEPAVLTLACDVDGKGRVSRQIAVDVTSDVVVVSFTGTLSTDRLGVPGVALSWTTLNASACTVTDGGLPVFSGGPAAAGLKPLGPAAPSLVRYTLSCRGFDGTTVAARAPVVVGWGDFLGGTTPASYGAALELLTGSIRIAHAALISVRFNNLRELGGDVDIHDNAQFQTMTAPGLTRVHGDVRIADNSALMLNDASLPLLADVGGSVLFADNQGPDTLSLPALLAVAGDLTLSHNAGEREVRLPLLASVDGSLVVEEQPDLVLLQMPALRHVGGSMSVLQNGRMACDDVVELVCQLQQPPLTLTISRNRNTCTVTTPRCAP